MNCLPPPQMLFEPAGTAKRRISNYGDVLHGRGDELARSRPLGATFVSCSENLLFPHPPTPYLAMRGQNFERSYLPGYFFS